MSGEGFLGYGLESGKGIMDSEWMMEHLFHKCHGTPQNFNDAGVESGSSMGHPLAGLTQSLIRVTPLLRQGPSTSVSTEHDTMTEA